MTDYLIKEDVFMALTGDITDCTIEEFIARLRDKLSKLPSVTPKEKTGKWESTEIFYGGESKGAIIKCSECGNEFKVSPKVFENLYGNERFCNYCGVRMVNE